MKCKTCDNEISDRDVRERFGICDDCWLNIDCDCGLEKL